MFDVEVAALIAAANADYAAYNENCAKYYKARLAANNSVPNHFDSEEKIDAWFAARNAEFVKDWRVDNNKKYLKIVRGGSAWAFIVKEDDGVFRAGDILKPASWAAPAKNAARGNILTGKFDIQWTGPLYLK